jgi:hypothetical protein
MPCAVYFWYDTTSGAIKWEQGLAAKGKIVFSFVTSTRPWTGAAAEGLGHRPIYKPVEALKNKTWKLPKKNF